MRKVVILAALGPIMALGACGENAGWNPNYSSMHNGSAYAKYMNEREAALHGKAPVPQVIPIKTPAQSPTAEDIAGKPATAQAAAATTGTAKTVVPANAQVAKTGPYPGSTPALVRYAYQEQQNPGTAKYKRSGGSQAVATRACGSFAGEDAAQLAFIAAGGPVIDPRGMDPDGDGFVCGWDPRPLRQPQL